MFHRTLKRLGAAGAAVGTMFAVATCIARQQPQSAKTQAARPLVVAMLGHDNSIRSLAWHQTLYLHPGVPGETSVESTQCFDDQGRWACTHIYQNMHGPDGTRLEDRERIVFDGRVLTGVSDSARSGTIRDYAGERGTESGVDCWLGRQLDVSGQERMGELLLNAPDLALDGFSPRGLPIVSGTVRLTPIVGLLEVEIDPEHGFAPRTITLRDRALRVPRYKYEVLEFTRVHDIWLPSRGRSTTRRYAPSPIEKQKLQAALATRVPSKSPDLFDPEVQRGYAAALKEAFGRDEAPSKELVPPKEVEVVVDSLNEPLEPGRFRLELPPDYSMLDVLHNTLRRAGSDAWVPNAGESSKAGPNQIGNDPAADCVVCPRVFELCGVAGERTNFEIFVRRVDRAPITVDGITTPGDWIKVERIARSSERAFEATVEFSCSQDEPRVYRGRLVGRVADDSDPPHAEVNLRVEEPLVASPPVLVWREKSGQWDEPTRQVRLLTNPLAKNSYVAASARVGDQSFPLKLSSITNDRNGSQLLSVTLDGSALPGGSASGANSVQLLDTQGKTLCTLPAVWFRESSLTPQ